MKTYVGLREAARYLNPDGVPPDRVLLHPTIISWTRAGYVRHTTDGDGKRDRVNILDVVVSTIALRAGKRWCGKRLHVHKINKPAAYTDPRLVRRLHAEMMAEGFPALLDFGPESPEPEADPAKLLREARANGESIPKLAKSLGILPKTAERAIKRIGRFA